MELTSYLIRTSCYSNICTQRIRGPRLQLILLLKSRDKNMNI